MRKISIVILNYLNWQDTIECVESLKLQTNQAFEVIIVDNHSNNESYNELVSIYSNNENIHLLQTENNLGYAQGNNVGILYSLNELKIDNILLVNNDTIFTDERFIEKLFELDISEHVGAVGPRITDSDGISQNPVYTKVNFFSVFKSIIGNLLRTLDIKTRFHGASNNTYNKNKDFILHGSAIFLTKNYLNKVNGLYPETFLYYEENILKIIFDKMNLNMVYDDSMFIYHKEDQSSKMAFTDVNKVKTRMELKSNIIAMKVLFSPINKISKFINDKPYVYEVNGEL